MQVAKEASNIYKEAQDEDVRINIRSSDYTMMRLKNSKTN